MSIRLSLYDFFSYTIPGVFYLLVIAYTVALFGLIPLDIEALSDMSLVSALVLAGAGYVLGIVLDPVAYQAYRLLFKRRSQQSQKVFQDFREYHPEIELKFKWQDRYLLLAFLRKTNNEYVLELERYNVYSLMLRNIGLGCLILAVVHAVYWITLLNSTWFIFLTVAFSLLCVLSFKQSAKFSHWFFAAILEAFVVQVSTADQLLASTPTAVQTDDKVGIEEQKPRSNSV